MKDNTRYGKTSNSCIAHRASRFPHPVSALPEKHGVRALGSSCKSLNEIAIGDVATCRFDVTAEIMDTFSRLSLDNNALHMDYEFAVRCGFRGRVAHGLIVLSAISRIIGTQLPGHGALWTGHDTEFIKPVYEGDSLQATVTVERISQAARTLILRTEVVNVATSTAVLRGSAKVHVPLRV